MRAIFQVMWHRIKTKFATKHLQKIRVLPHPDICISGASAGMVSSPSYDHLDLVRSEGKEPQTDI
ncbi:MAG: hypothetical protein EBT07_04610 [Actinobacteria bacterium]|nr:hypothetical protein [Actinomycetota bacterium]